MTMHSGGKKKGAVFLDRDGTINEEVGYLDRPEKLRLVAGAARAIRLLNESGLKVIVVTNQSGVGRGFFDEKMVATIHEHLQELLRAEGAWIDRYYYCPHHPTHGRGRYLIDCPCRKPAPGMLLSAAEDLGIALEESYMVGDMLKDVEAGIRAGAIGVLVETGYGVDAAAKLASLDGDDAVNSLYRPAFIASTIEVAARWILDSIGDKKR